MELILIIFISYLVGLVITFLVVAIIEDMDVKWKYLDVHPLWICAWPLLTILLFRDLIVYINNYLKINNLNQMNLKILGKAMGFMFLPTLGVLLMLLVGFFDPIILWTWIKSPSGWAIFTRVILFLLETGLVIVMYFHYLEEENHNKYLAECDDIKVNRSNKKSTYGIDTIYELFPGDRGSYKYFKIPTDNPDIMLVERKPQ